MCYNIAFPMKGGVLTNFIWAVQMPGFMLVSGYFSYRPLTDLKDGWRRVVGSAEHYAMPFFTWFFLISVLLLGQFDRHILRALGTLMTHVDSGLWFLWVIFVLSVVATGCNIAMGKGKNRTIQIIGVLITCAVCLGILGALGLKFSLSFIGIKYILYYAVFYGFGWLAKATEKKWRKWLKVKGQVLFASLVIFLAIVYNFDLYHCDDDMKSIFLRYIAGFTGNAVILGACEKFKVKLEKAKFDWLGRYTLEIYCTHMYVNNLFIDSNGNRFFTRIGFGNFMVSLICTIAFTTVIIVVLKSNPIANWLLYGKKEKK